MNYQDHLLLSRKWKAKNKEKVRAYRKVYYLKNKNRTSIYNQQWAEDNKEKALESRRKYSQKKRYPEKILARTRLNTAVILGKVKKLPCARCGKEKTYGHHHLGYSKQHWLDVQWLCSTHHTEVHHG